MRSGRIRRWAGKAQGCMRPIVRFRSGLRPSLHHTMEVKTQNQISHDSWYKERGHSSLIDVDRTGRKLLFGVGAVFGRKVRNGGWESGGLFSEAVID